MSAIFKMLDSIGYILALNGYSLLDQDDSSVLIRDKKTDTDYRIRIEKEAC